MKIQTPMNSYRFHLQKYRYGSKTDCPQCERKRCFVKYIDDENEIFFPSTVGRCDHEQSCGYHYTPKDYFRDHPWILSNKDKFLPNTNKQFFSFKKSKPMNPSYIDEEIVRRSLSHYNINPLYKYLSFAFGEKETKRLFQTYKVGTSNKWNGATVFWQIDSNQKVRTGKVMLYDPKTGHRVKEPQAYVSWAHTELKLPDFNLSQCLFGEHLISTNPNRKIFIVESEKTALIMCHFMPDYLWLATGGKNGSFKMDAMKILNGRDVILIPDLGAWEEWNNKASLLKGVCKSISVSDILEKSATEEQRQQGLDIADFFLEKKTPQQLLNEWCEENPLLRQLIDELDCEIIDE